MTLRMVRKPPVGNVRSDRLKVTLAGSHTMKQKACMLMQVKFWLHQEHGIDNAGPTDVYLSLLYLFTFGSVIGFTAYGWLLRNARPVVATSYAYINPVLAVLLGAALHHEPLGWTTVVANVLIVTAVILALRRPRTGASTHD